MTAGERRTTRDEAREHLRAYAAAIDALEAGTGSPEGERAALEDALRHATRALEFAVRRAGDGKPPTAAFDALHDLAREAGVEPETADTRPPEPSLPDRNAFERWLLTGVPVLLAVSLPRGGAVIGDALERAYGEYERAAPGSDRVERLGALVPLLESLYGLYVRAALDDPAGTSPEEVARTTLSLALLATAGAGGAS